MSKCKYCEDLYEIEWECVDEPHHGEEANCEECGAEYYGEWGGKIWATTDKAKLNHPELEKL